LVDDLPPYAEQVPPYSTCHRSGARDDEAKNLTLEDNIMTILRLEARNAAMDTASCKTTPRLTSELVVAPGGS